MTQKTIQPTAAEISIIVRACLRMLDDLREHIPAGSEWATPRHGIDDARLVLHEVLGFVDQKRWSSDPIYSALVRARQLTYNARNGPVSDREIDRVEEQIDAAFVAARGCPVDFDGEPMGEAAA